MNLLTLKIELENEFGYKFTIPKELDKGILSTTDSFTIAKLQKLTPNNVAKDICDNINEYLKERYPNIESSCLGPYVNLNIITLTNSQIEYSLPIIEDKVLLDYVSPNVAKELHLGHMRNMNIGDSVRRLLLIKYPNLITDNHWGDWGVQFGKIIWAFKKFQTGLDSLVIINDEELPINLEFYNTDPLQALVRMYVWAEQHKLEYKDYDSEVRNEFLKLEEKDPVNYSLWQDFVNISKEEVNKDMQLFNIPKHDLEQGESYYEKYNDEVYNFMEKSNLWQKEGKARFIDFEQLSELIDRPEIKNLGYGYLISSTGYTTYLFRDLCARFDWTSRLKTNLMITVTGNEQLHHFKQLLALCDYISTIKTPFLNSQLLSVPHIEHLSYGFLTLKGGQKMSSRKGIIQTTRKLYNDVYTQASINLKEREVVSTSVNLPTSKKDSIDKIKDENKEESLDPTRIITLAAIKWTDLSKDTVHDIEFDINAVLHFEGNTGMYQLYTYARINSILEKIKANPINFDYNILNQKEKILYNTLLTAPYQLNESITRLKPHIITNYCYDLANQFNSWYNTTSLINETDSTRQETVMLLLLELKIILKYMLDKLGIEVLDKI